MTKTSEGVSIPLDPGWGEIRDGVRHVCERVPQRVLGEARPRERLSDRVRRCADRGRLPRRADPGGVRRRRAAAVGRLRHPRDHPRDGLQRGRLPRADVHHGHGAAARQRRAEAEVPAGHRLGRAAPAGVRRHRAHHRLRHHPAQDARRQEGQRPLRRQRPEGVDQPRAALRPDAAARAHHAARQGARSAPTGSPCSSSTCARPRARASRSARSTP